MALKIQLQIAQTPWCWDSVVRRFCENASSLACETFDILFNQWIQYNARGVTDTPQDNHWMVWLLQTGIDSKKGKLSGGEQQMLALARALIPKPKLFMLDEPSLGLSPALVAEVFDKVRQISADTGVSLLIVEQKVRDLLPICDRVYSLKLGKTVYSGPASELQDDPSRLKELFL
jgi:ABC-type branched-subunit amino acid transport system ATPase component